MTRKSLPLPSLVVTLLAACLLLTPPASYALTPVDPAAALRAAQNWTLHSRDMRWTASLDNLPQSLNEIRVEGRLIGYVAPLDQGYVIVPACRELPPVSAYSSDASFNLSDQGGFAVLLQEELARKIEVVEAALAASPPLPEMRPVLEQIDLDRALWESYTSDYEQFSRDVAARSSRALDDIQSVEPLLRTVWHQGLPYYEQCPQGSGGRTVVGCVATAAAQILAFWRAQFTPTGSKSYVWNGDQSCGGTTAAQTLSANFADSYDWDNILNAYSSSATAAQRSAVAELCYETGVAVSMDYGHCGSGASLSGAVGAFRSYFGMASDIDVEARSAYTSAAAWFQMLQQELNQARPLFYVIRNHAIVCDGWRVSGTNQLHFNYGWADSHNAWFTVDNLYCTWSGCSPSIEQAVRRIHPVSSAPVVNLSLSAPNGGEALVAGSTVTVSWTSSGISGNVQIELNRNYPSASWEPLMSASAAAGSASWTVSGALSSSARMRVVSAAPAAGDTSNASFAIVTPAGAPAVAVTYPNGGQQHYLNSTLVIRWNSASLPAASRMRIQLNRNYPYGTWETLTSNITNCGLYAWRAAGAASSRVRIRVLDFANAAIGDTSDANFALATPLYADAPLPLETGLDAATPNPFNPATQIHFRLADASRVRLEVFDITGRLVETLLDADRAPGSYAVPFDGTALGSGIYLVRLYAGATHSVQRIVLLR